MCGILALLLAIGEVSREDIVKHSRIHVRRGPDWSGYFVSEDESVGFGHERLSIVNPASGSQPLHYNDWVVAVNGEIYNHHTLRDSLNLTEADLGSGSDCAIIAPLLIEYGPVEACKKLDGPFSFVAYNTTTKEVVTARDPYGVNPLYCGEKNNRFCFSSTLKGVLAALGDDCNVSQFPPGHCHVYSLVGDDCWNVTTHRYHSHPVIHENAAPEGEFDPERLFKLGEEAVMKRMMSDVPYAWLLSGGVDSSAVVMWGARHALRRVEDGEESEANFPRMHTFTVGMEGSPDFEPAREIAALVNSVHHELFYTTQEAIDVLPEVIYAIETCDPTTVRASIPFFFLMASSF